MTNTEEEKTTFADLFRSGADITGSLVNGANHLGRLTPRTKKSLAAAASIMLLWARCSMRNSDKPVEAFYHNPIPEKSTNYTPYLIGAGLIGAGLVGAGAIFNYLENKPKD